MKDSVSILSVHVGFLLTHISYVNDAKSISTHTSSIVPISLAYASSIYTPHAPDNGSSPTILESLLVVRPSELYVNAVPCNAGLLPTSGKLGEYGWAGTDSAPLLFKPVQ